MMNFGQLSTIYHGIKQQEGETAATATREVIVHVFGQVQAFISDTATLGETADQVVNTIEYLDKTRTDVQIDRDALYAWAWAYTTNSHTLPNGITLTPHTRTHGTQRTLLHRIH